MAISLVAGATGLVGSHVLKQLALVEESPIAVLRRTPNDLPDNVMPIEVDFDELLASGDLPHCDHLYLCFCLLYTSPSPRDQRGSRMPSSA